MINLFRYLKGYVTIQIKGEYSERFINLCKGNGISVWDIDRLGDNLFINVFARDYRRIPKLRRDYDSKIKIKILNKHGFPFIINRYKKRPGIFAGLVVFLAINILLSQFIWIIEVEGNEKIKSEEIIFACNEIGINIGDRREEIDTYNSKNQLAVMFEDVAWSSLNIEGSKLTVNISEANDSKTETSELPRNIVASSDGVIKKIEVTKGVKNVVVNQAVRKGDLLVSGIVENPSQIHFVSASGKVMAETNITCFCELDKKFNFNENQKFSEQRCVLKFFWLELPLYLTGVNYKAETEITEDYLVLFGKKLPIGIISKNYKKIENTMINLSQTDAKNLALASFSESLRNSGVEDVLSIDCRVEESKNTFKVTVNALCYENICEYKVIKAN